MLARGQSKQFINAEAAAKDLKSRSCWIKSAPTNAATLRILYQPGPGQIPPRQRLVCSPRCLAHPESWMHLNDSSKLSLLLREPVVEANYTSREGGEHFPPRSSWHQSAGLLSAWLAPLWRSLVPAHEQVPRGLREQSCFWAAGQWRSVFTIIPPCSSLHSLLETDSGTPISGVSSFLACLRWPLLSAYLVAQFPYRSAMRRGRSPGFERNPPGTQLGFQAFKAGNAQSPLSTPRSCCTGINHHWVSPE